MSIREQAILVSLQISSWTGRKGDKETTTEILQNKNATSDCGKFTKRLMPKERTSEFITVAQDAREYHKSLTLPWSEGKGMLPMKLYQDYIEKMNDFKIKFDDAAQRFIDNYDQYVYSAQNELNGLYRPEDYPSSQKISKKFKMTVEFEPIPDHNDLRLSISDSQKEELKSNIESHVVHKQEQAMRDLWRRLYDVVNNMQEILSKDNTRIHESLVEKIVDLTNILPDMNIGSDSNLEAKRQEVVSKLCGYSIKDIRDDKGLRTQLATDAKSIVDSMAGYMGDLNN